MPVRPKLYAAVAAAFAAVLSSAVFAQSFEERMAPCLACHGEQGQTPDPEVPSLGGQPAPYLLIQLYLFREKQRKVEIMNDVTETFTDDDLRTFSDYLAKLPPPKPPADTGDAARMQAAAGLITRFRCNACHNLDLSGKENVPRIAAQSEHYLLKTMREYKNSTRHGYDAAMAEALAPVSDAQLVELAYYIARFR